MNKKIKKKWIKALRSGDYKQGKGQLCEVVENDVSYCCLGVLIETVRGEDTWREPKNTFFDCYDLVPNGSNEPHFPSKNFLKEVGLNKKTAADLAVMNDDGSKSFKQIADWIEENL